MDLLYFSYGLQTLCQYYNITQGSIEIGCDGKAALVKVFGNNPINLDDPNFDLLSAIQKLKHSSQIHWTFRHIKGHQDDSIPLSSLDRWAKLNIEMDARAKDHINIARQKPRQSVIGQEPWSLWIQGKKNYK